MWLGQLDPVAWECLVAAQHTARARGCEQIEPDHLMAGLLRDQRGSVADALRGSGASLARLQDALDLRSRTGHEDFSQRTVRQNEVQPTAKTRTILERALVEATSREHLYIEPGHVLLALTSEVGCFGNEVLLDLGVDLDILRERLLAQLPSETIDESLLQQSSEQFPRLTAEETRRLTSDVAAWREAARLMEAEPDALTASERRALRRVREETREAWLRLHEHHRYLVWAAAKACANQGHDLAYAFDMAGKVLTAACFEFEPHNGEAFDEYAKSYITTKLGELLDCALEES